MVRNAYRVEGEMGGKKTNQVLKLSSCLFNNTILTSENDTHSRKITDFCSAYDKRVDVEPPSGKDT